MPPHPSDEELAVDWTLPKRDGAFLLTDYRDPEDRCAWLDITPGDR
jgi:hypothetical protein